MLSVIAYSICGLIIFILSIVIMAKKSGKKEEDVSDELIANALSEMVAIEDQPQSKARIGKDWQNKRLSKLHPSNIIDDEFATKYELKKDDITSKEEQIKKIIRDNGFIVSERHLGSGKYGNVVKCVSAKDQSKEFACKKMVVTKYFADFKHEVFYLNRLKSENIVKCEKHFVIDDTGYMVLKYANHGSVSDILKRIKSTKEKTFTEDEAKLCFTHIARAIHCMHVENGIAHRDLKLANVLKVVNADNQVVYKVCDFGKSRTLVDQYNIIKTKGFAGTLNYMSPELLRAYITFRLKETVEGRVRTIDGFKSDMWALGVCLYYLICNDNPFLNEGERKLFTLKRTPTAKLLLKKAENNEWKIPRVIHRNLSAQCIEIMAGVIEPNRMLRLEIFDVIAHQWINSVNTSDS